MSEICGEHRYDAEDYQWCPFCEIERFRSKYEAQERIISDLRSQVAENDKRIEDLEHLAALYADGNQFDAHRAAVALGLEDDDE
jgi:HEAT repeat protein